MKSKQQIKKITKARLLEEFERVFDQIFDEESARFESLKSPQKNSDIGVNFYSQEQLLEDGLKSEIQMFLGFSSGNTESNI